MDKGERRETRDQEWSEMRLRDTMGGKRDEYGLFGELGGGLIKQKRSRNDHSQKAYPFDVDVMRIGVRTTTAMMMKMKSKIHLSLPAFFWCSFAFFKCSSPRWT